MSHTGIGAQTHLGHPPLFSSGHSQGSGSEAEHLGHELLLILDTSFMGSGLTCGATLPVLSSLICKATWAVDVHVFAWGLGKKDF